MRPAWATALVLAGPLVFSGCDGDGSDLGEPAMEYREVATTLGEIRACSSTERARHQDHEGRQAGIQPYLLPFSEYIGYAWADGSWSQNWCPVNGRKQSMCGRLVVHHDGDCDDSGDSCYKIVPDSASSYLFNDVQSSDKFRWNGTQCVKGASVGQPCVEGEVGAPMDFNGAPLFQGSSSSMLNKNICVYGPWVKDEGHSDRPEIHPAELTWFRLNEGMPTNARFVLLMRDATGRFDDPTDFDDLEASSRPWAGRPLSGRMYASVTIPPSKSIRLNLGTWASSGVVTDRYSDYQDTEPGSTMALTVSGVPVLTVNETSEVDPQLAVTLSKDNFCREADGTLRGYVLLRAKVGASSDRKYSGYLWFTIWQSESTRSSLVLTTVPNLDLTMRALVEKRDDGRPVDLVTPTVKTRIVPESLSNGSDGFANDIMFRLGKNMDSTAEDMEVISVVHDDGKATRVLRVEQAADEAGTFLIRSVPVRDGDLVFMTKSGRQMRHRVAGSALTLKTTTATPVAAHAAPEAWESLAKSVPGLEGAPSLQNHLRHVTEWELSMLPQYQELRNGRVKKEPSLSLQVINDDLSGQIGAKLKKVFGTESPIDIRWSFTARDVTAQADVPVVTGRKNVPGAVRAEILAPGKLRIVFPEERTANVIRLEATATATDVNGLRATTTHSVYSHAVSASHSGELLAGVLAAAAKVTGLSEGSVLATLPLREVKAAKRDIVDWLKLARAAAISIAEQDQLLSPRRRAEKAQIEILQTSTFADSSDNVMTVEELGHLFSNAKKVSEHLQSLVDE